MSVFQVRRIAAAGGLALTLGLLTACGGSSDAASPSSSTSSSSGSAEGSSSSGTGQTQTLTVTEVGFDIEPESSDLPAGNYTITVKNEGDATHDLVVEQDGEDVARSDSIGPGEEATLTVTLEPGKYVFYCSIGNHRAMGMETDVTVG